MPTPTYDRLRAMGFDNTEQDEIIKAMKVTREGVEEFIFEAVLFRAEHLNNL